MLSFQFLGPTVFSKARDDASTRRSENILAISRDNLMRLMLRERCWGKQRREDNKPLVPSNWIRSAVCSCIVPSNTNPDHMVHLNTKVSCRNSWRAGTTFMSGTPFLTFQRRSLCHWRKRKLIHPLVWKESMDPENLFQKLNIQKTPQLQMKLKKLLHRCLWKFL